MLAGALRSTCIRVRAVTTTALSDKKGMLMLAWNAEFTSVRYLDALGEDVYGPWHGRWESFEDGQAYLPL